MKTSQFDYDLPPERIAQTPLEPRHDSRMLVIDRAAGELFDRKFTDLGEFLQEGDLLVINKTKVIPARIMAMKPSGGKVEILLLRQKRKDVWECLVGGKRVNAGITLQIPNGPGVEVLENLEGSRRIIQFNESVDAYLTSIGEMPLPPYIHEPLKDQNRYQTVYAETSGSAAAPTAGLHFTEEIISGLKAKGVKFCEITLHVGLDTFAPVTEEHPEEHIIHSEWCELTPESAEMINQTHQNGGRIIAVGTTSVRTLESASRNAKAGEVVAAIQGDTNLFIVPGYKFQVVDALITNFHLPRSTLLMLVSAFAGQDLILKAYQHAIAQEYRFYSFGDASLIL